MLIDLETYAPGQVSKLEAPLRELKLSEAMRIGAALRPQCYGNYFIDGRSCAIGAAWEGFGFSPPKDSLTITVWWSNHKWPNVIALNDHTCWTREAIADWLERQGL